MGACPSKLVGPSEAIEKILGFMKKPKGILLYHGVPGTGKTYLCAALTVWIFRTFQTQRYHREQELLRRLRLGISEGKGDYLINLEYFIDDEIAILDDVGAGINPTKETNRDLEFRREVFLAFLDYRYNSRKPTIITSNFTRQQFYDVYSERIDSRLFASENTIISIFGDGLDKRQMGM